MRLNVALLAVCLAASAFAQSPDVPSSNEQSSVLEEPTANIADTGTNGDVIMSSPQPYSSAGILLQAKTAWPDIIAKVGTSTSASAFAVASASDSRLFTVRGDGNVGIGTSTPGTGGVYATPLTVHSTSELGSYIKISNSDPAWSMGGVWLPDHTFAAGWLFGTDNTGKALIRYGTGEHETTALTAAKDGVVGLAIDKTGDVGIGTTTPNHKLDVVGNANFSGTVTGGNIQAKYQDVAEWVDADADLAPGTVVVVNPERVNGVTAATRAYDTSVAGVVSQQPGLILGESGEAREMVATTGRVRVRVDATAHPIAIGDLLVSSDRRGYAEKSRPLDVGGTSIHRPGTIIGKALEPLAGRTGEILVLLSLQ